MFSVIPAKAGIQVFVVEVGQDVDEAMNGCNSNAKLAVALRTTERLGFSRRWKRSAANPCLAMLCLQTMLVDAGRNLLAPR